MKKALVDSDVLIWFLRGNTNAAAALAALDDWSISAITYMEVAQGCRNKAELRVMQQTLRGALGVDVLHLSQAISNSACTLVEQYALSHSLYMADAMIAATAMHFQLPLLTGNAKHFSPIKGLNLLAFSVL